MAIKADWYVLPGEFVAASGTVDGDSEIRVLNNRIIIAGNESNQVRVYSMKNITDVLLYWRDGAWCIEWKVFSPNFSHGIQEVRVKLGTNWDWAHKLFYQIQCRL